MGDPWSCVFHGNHFFYLNAHCVFQLHLTQGEKEWHSRGHSGHSRAWIGQVWVGMGVLREVLLSLLRVLSPVLGGWTLPCGVTEVI